MEKPRWRWRWRVMNIKHCCHASTKGDQHSTHNLWRAGVSHNANTLSYANRATGTHTEIKYILHETSHATTHLRRWLRPAFRRPGIAPCLLTAFGRPGLADMPFDNRHSARREGARPEVEIFLVVPSTSCRGAIGEKVEREGRRKGIERQWMNNSDF